MNKKNFLIPLILGILIISMGILFTVIPLFNFNGQTFKLLPAILSGIFLPFIGIIVVIASITIHTNKKYDNEIEEIAKNIKKEIDKHTTDISQTSTKICEYCGAENVKEDICCKSCGAKLKK